MRALLAGLALLAAMPAAAQLPDFSAVVRDAASAVIQLRAILSPVLPDLPLAEDEAEDADPERRYFGQGAERQSLGAGFVVDAAGYILTNAHLVANGEDITVRFADRRELEARLVGYDPASDIALLKVEAAGLPVARIGDPRALRPGEGVAAIGSPFGLEHSVTAGIVSALGRVLPENSVVPFIQTDVAVNPGNSGGPLINARGEVVGVITSFYTDAGGYTGLAFAVPIDVAMVVARQLRAHGRVSRGVIGVRLQEVSAELARAFGLPRPSGALVLEAFRGGAAERAGIRAGDVIVRFDGKPVENEADLVQLASAAAPGRTVDVEMVRFGKTLGARVRVLESPTPPMPRATEPDAALGLLATPLTTRLRERLRLDAGLLVERPGNAGERAGLARGDIVLSVNGRSVATMADFNQALEAAGRGATVALLVQRVGIRQFLPLRLPR
jgi:serine protease Do